MTEVKKMLEFCMPILTKRGGRIGNALLTPEQAKEYDFILCQRDCIHNRCWIPSEADQSTFECGFIMGL